MDEIFAMTNCEHNWQYTYGVDIAYLIVAAKVCTECFEIIRLGYPGIDKIEQEWYDAELGYPVISKE